MAHETKTRSWKKEEDSEAYRHEAVTRKNAVPVGLASYDTSKPKPKKYEYDPHLKSEALKILFITSSRFALLTYYEAIDFPPQKLGLR